MLSMAIILLGFGMSIAGGIKNWKFLEWSGWAIAIFGIGLGLLGYFG
jgi:hypothetical protein